MGLHYVPKRYLRDFEASGKPEYIWTFDKQKETLRCLPIEKVAQSPGYYEPSVESDLANKGGDTRQRCNRQDSGWRFAD